MVYLLNMVIFHGYVPNGGDSRLPRQTIMSPEFQQAGEGMAGTVGTSKNLERGEEWPRLQLGGISLRVSYALIIFDFNVALSTLFLEPYSLTAGIANVSVTLCVKCEETWTHCLERNRRESFCNVNYQIFDDIYQIFGYI